MKHIAALTCLLLSANAYALQGNDCASRSEKIIPAERGAFMKSCLAQAESPANVREETRRRKDAQCEQNAKNKKLQGGEKAAYVASCMNKNEAATAANTKPKKVIPSKHDAAAPVGSKTKPAPQKPAKTRSNRALSHSKDK